MKGAVRPVTLNQMVNWQVDTAMESGQGMILVCIISETNCIMCSVQDQWTRIINTEYKKTAECPEEPKRALANWPNM